MIRIPERILLARVLSWVALIATLIVTPAIVVDPLNLPKLLVITLGSLMSLGIIAREFKTAFRSNLRFPILLTTIFILDLGLVFFLAGTNSSQEFYGTFGRSTGFIAYFSLAGLLIAGLFAASDYAFKHLTWFLISAGAFSILYGLIQFMGHDPVRWANIFSPVIGFLGNTNFQSSFIGFTAIAAFAIIIQEKSIPVRLGLAAFFALAIFVIYLTESKQGFVVLLGGIGIVLLMFINVSKFKRFTLPLLTFGLIGVICGVIGVFNKGPLAPVLYEESVTYRGDYWRAAWKMSVENPLFGVGLDSYGDWYRRARTIEATIRRGPEIVSNAAHNVFLDFSSNGGFPLLLIYIVMVFIVLRAGIRVIRRSSQYSPYFSALFSVWCAYQVQSLISINQLGIAVWAWVISGLIIGWEICGRIDKVESNKNQNKKRIFPDKTNRQIMPVTSLSIFAGLLIGLLVVLPPWLASAKLKSALDSGSFALLANSAKSFPQDGYQGVQVAYVFYQNKLDEQALPILLDVTKKYPDIFDAWRLLSRLSTATPAQIGEAEAQMKRLDPYNPDLK